MPSTAKGRRPSRGEQVRIIGGEWRSRRLRFPAARDLRPTPDRVRETLFNWLGQTVTGWRALDLFAGSGVLGFEALSRGAAWVGFVEQSPRVARAIAENLEQLGADHSRYVVWTRDALKWLDQPKLDDGSIDLVFLDPPFRQPALLQNSLERVAAAPWLAEGARVFVEGADLDALRLPAGFVVSRETRAGESRSVLLARE
ncbi:16S rRNA (guanine(966)-N(2))-methyltransferase RsmD [Guyparkeria hydrothermalis]|uniref:16S rRNA (guanine(966)-N(2))-methyltransferase RsmD n=1 Tax=Guyparkeria hydrothermalis TaxID=923 RepID=UPI0020209115|nr:16S rRNA (guanine(966)-N(2))-methyltransferase RsmD [Guyparkeria hydrothermalis]MCL7743429.1 16S rRNA (guanine(966)-N(2))-methyltransferase RsmD [Guyparkeria hydrothermalis]